MALGLHTKYAFYLRDVGVTGKAHILPAWLLGYTQSTHSTCSNHLHKTMQQLAVNVTCTFPRISLTAFDCNEMYRILFGITFDDHQVLFEASVSLHPLMLDQSLF